MRASLCTHPKVLMIAEIIGESVDVGRRLSTGFNGSLNEIVTCDVTRDVTLAALLRVWCATNEHTDDGIWKNSTLRTIDQAAGIPGFGEAMQEAGWAIYDEDARTVELPNFLENNAPAKDNARSTAAERQARYREKLRAARAADGESSSSGDVTRDVTVSVTSNAREEKRREEKKEPKSKAEASASRLPADWMPTEGEISFCQTERPDLNPVSVASQFRDYWIAQPGAKGRKLDWPATWRNWVRNQRGTSGPRQIHSYHDERAETIAALTGRNRYEHESEATDQRQLRIAVAG